ncbi:hypothetical protein [Pseudomonas sp.]|uniref:hypothetical protein n=1 Tax=Pseudomonas sp. TaxID=306 RepID=UPI0039C92330
MAAVTLAGALKGIEEGCDPGPAAEGNSYNDAHVSDLPRTGWRQSSAWRVRPLCARC